MNVLVAGATGKTGRRVVAALSARGHRPIALVRAGSDTSVLQANVQLRRGDLTELADDVCGGCDAVVFAAGAGSSTSRDMTERVDRDGAKRLMDLADQANVQRFVMLSSVGAGDPDPDSELAHYLQAKHDADEYLKASNLTYAIIRPVTLTDEDGSGEIRLDDDVDVDGEAARGDVAAVLAAAVDNDSWVGAVHRMQSA